MWWVDVASVLVSPTLQKSAWGLTAEAIVIRNKTEEGKGFGKTSWSETRVMADVYDSLISRVIGARAITIVKSVQRRLLITCKLNGLMTLGILPLA